MAENTPTESEIGEINNPEEIPQLISTRIEEYILNGRPELDGAHERGMSYGSSLDRRPGSRGGFCGFAKEYGVEVIDKLSKDGHNLAGVGIQAERLNAVDNSSTYYRRHGFVIAIDRDTEEWWLIDNTFNQFVEEDESGNLKMSGSNIEIDSAASTTDTVSSVANQLLEKNYVKLDKQNLAAYMTLMLARGSANKYDALLKLFADNDKFVDCLSDLVYRTDNMKHVGNWDRIWNAISDKLILQ